MLDFIGIGAQKAGTTWLQKRLELHPRIRFPAGKEIHFWDKERARGVDWWLGLFAAPADDIKRGEITPAYTTLPAATVAEVHQAAPQARLFLSLRNPMSRAWSAAQMDAKFADLDPRQQPDDWYIERFRSAGSLLRGDYLAALDNWTAAYGAAALLTILFDEIEQRPKATIRKVAAHIGVDPDFYAPLARDQIGRPVFVGQRLALRPSLLPILREIYLPQIDRLAARLDRSLDHWRSWTGADGR